jgi:hypothetical protein
MARFNGIFLIFKNICKSGLQVFKNIPNPFPSIAARDVYVFHCAMSLIFCVPPSTTSTKSSDAIVSNTNAESRFVVRTFSSSRTKIAVFIRVPHTWRRDELI